MMTSAREGMRTPGAEGLRAIFFDAGNTLLRMNYEVIAAQLATLGIEATPLAIQRAEWQARVRLDAEVFARWPERTSTESGSTSGRYLRLLLEGVGITDERTLEAVAAWRRAYNLPGGLWNTADPEATAALRLVREAGLRAAVVSNSDGSVRSILEGLGLTRYLDFVIDSGEVGVEKPDPRIFRIALDQAGLEAGSVVYVGDLYSVDVLGARRVGMDAVLLDPGRCWGERGCLAAPGPLAAVEAVLAARGVAGGSVARPAPSGGGIGGHVEAPDEVNREG